MRRLIFAFALAGLLAGCATTPKHLASVQIEPLPPSEQAWRDAITPTDAALLDALPTRWSAVVGGTKASGGAAVAAAGPLLRPDAALDHPELSPGSYRCHIVRIWKSAGRARVRSFEPNFCYISDEQDGLSFAKQTGSDLPSGYLYADGNRRYVFLGARQLKPGDVSLGYGVDAARDLAGVVERYGAFRWRLVVPRPGDDTIDIYELTPVPADQQPS